MYQSTRWQIFGILIICQMKFELSLPSVISGGNFTNWSEDEYIEKRFFMDTKFIFNHQRFDNLAFRIRMNQWSLELSSGNRSHLNKFWTELHLFLDRRHHSTSLNNSIRGPLTHHCYPPIISPLTNDSTVHIPELSDMDQRIAQYYTQDGFFRTINYIHCTLDERRLQPTIHIQMNIYLVTNRDFQSLIYIEMSNATQELLSNSRARFYLHSHETKFRYNFNVSNIDRPLNSNTSLVRMIKLYTAAIPARSSSVMIVENIIIIGFNFVIFLYFFL